MSRRILVRVSQSGEITVEAEGFKGNGCEAATKAIEAALGKSRGRTRKADLISSPHSAPSARPHFSLTDHEVSLGDLIISFARNYFESQNN